MVLLMLLQRLRRLRLRLWLPLLLHLLLPHTSCSACAVHVSSMKAAGDRSCAVPSPQK